MFTLAAILVLFVAVYAVLALRPVPKVKAHRGCSNATLQGAYGLTAFGAYSSVSPWSPSTVVGLVTFDGNGHFSGTLTLVGGGHIYTPATTFSGVTYTVTSSCTITTGEIDLQGTEVTLNGTVVDATGGSEVITDMEAPSAETTTLTVDMKKVQGWD
jgi:hypothetical protein